jgi:FlaG/FlaF family flagellin (archaellin)
MNRTEVHSKEGAVSPVVGVMLMLVVTIIIAAVVSAFSGSMATGKEKAPQASLDCRIVLDDGAMTGTPGPVFTMKHMGGDPINTKNVRLVTSWVNESGIYNVQSTVAPNYVEATEQYFDNGTATRSEHYSLASLNTHYLPWTGSGDIYYNVPYLVIPADLPSDGSGHEASTWFGNYIFRAGDVVKADVDNTILGAGMSQNQATPIIKSGHLLTGNEVVNVKLIDLKSGTTIYDRDIVVEV